MKTSIIFENIRVNLSVGVICDAGYVWKPTGASTGYRIPSAMYGGMGGGIACQDLLRQDVEDERQRDVLGRSSASPRPRHTVHTPGHPLDQFLVSPCPEHKRVLAGNTAAAAPLPFQKAVQTSRFRKWCKTDTRLSC